MARLALAGVSSAEQPGNGTYAGRRSHPGKQRVAPNKESSVEDHSCANGVDPWFSLHGVGKDVDGRDAIMLNNPSSGCQLPAGVIVRDRTQTSQTCVNEGDGGEDNKPAPLGCRTRGQPGFASYCRAGGLSALYLPHMFLVGPWRSFMQRGKRPSLSRRRASQSLKRPHKLQRFHVPAQS